MADKTNAKSTTKRSWVPKYNKYLDELTNEEWEEMANATCGTECDVVPDPKASK